MKKLALALSVFAALILTVSAAWAAENVILDSVDIGDVSSEAGHDLVGWGPIEPTASGGNYGGITNTRCIWDAGDYDPTATVVLHTPRGSAQSLIFSHLDGLADDSFNVYALHANGTWVLVDSYTDLLPTEDTETWHPRTVDLVSPDLAQGRDLTIKFEATGPSWGSFGTYGQVCFDTIELHGNGAPR